jgi:hypothetical protein
MILHVLLEGDSLRNLKFFICFIFCLNSCFSKDVEYIPLNKLSQGNELVGGFSGLFLESNQDKDVLIFMTHSDRGPNGDKIEDPRTGQIKRRFMYPDFQPFWKRFSINRKTKEIKLLNTIGLTLPNKKPLTGISNNNEDEVLIDGNGKELKKDINGIDPESICFDGRFFWMGEEYGPSLLKFSQAGELLRRYVPETSYAQAPDEIYKDSLPKVLLKTKLNRGFEGVACDGDKVYAILQSPLPGENLDVRLIEFNSVTEKVERELFYPLDSKKADKIGDMVFSQGFLYILEQNDEVGDNSFHKVYKVELSSFDKPERVNKILVKDLVKAGYSFAEKIEGLTVINDQEIAIVNDNDFGVHDSSAESIMAILKMD